MAHSVIFMIDPFPATNDAPSNGWAATVQRLDDDEPTLRVTDLGAARGDGIFETFGVVGGHPQAVEAHLARLENSAGLLDLPRPNRDQWRTAIAIAAEALPTDRQGGIKLVITRGIEGTDRPTAWIVATTSARDYGERRSGIRVVTLERGYPSDVAARAPWLLAGAKTLSYAVNMAALREAARREADDVIFVSTDGYVMEAPTATVVMRFGDTFTTPRTDIGILPGTSQLSLFEFYRGSGFRAEEALVPAAALGDADAIWLVSSVRLAAPVTHIDGEAIAVDAAMTDRMNDALLARVD